MSESVQHTNKSFIDGTNRVTKLKRSKAKCVRWYKAVWIIFTEFCERSSIHGIRYLTERTLHWSERFWWLISLVTSVFVCIFFIHQIWLKLTPVVITFNDEATPLSEINFPTITICNDNPISPSVLNYSHYLDLMVHDFDVSEKIVQQMYAASAFCGYKDLVNQYILRRNVQTDRNILPHLEYFSPDLLQKCFYTLGENDYHEHCNDGFSTVLTDYGLCYTFNHLSSADIYNMELLADDFPKVKPFRGNVGGWSSSSFFNITYPYRMQHSGRGMHLLIALPKSERIFERFCSPYMNFRNSVILFIHPAEEVQQLDKRYYIIPLKNKAHLTVRPHIVSTDASLFKNYNKYQRKCVAENEKELKFFQKYTQSNCQLELLINETLKTCNCSHFWMPRANDTKICAATDIKCSFYVKTKIIPHSNSTNKCLPACNFISYDVDIYFSKLHDGWYENVHDISDGTELVATEISISIENEEYFGLKRSEKYGKIDFLAGCGGILGLFMGVSFLSIIELIYFATLRVVCNRRKKWVAKKQLESLNNETEMEANPMSLESEIGASENEIVAPENEIESLENEIEAPGNEKAANEIVASEN